MSALTPVRPVLRPIHALASFRMNSGTYSNRSPRFIALVFRPFRLQPSGVAHRRFITLPLSSIGFRFRGLGFATGMPAFPYHQTESSSFPYGLGVRLLLLPTPPHGDAVALGFGPESVCPERTSTSLTNAPFGRTYHRALADGVSGSP